MTDLHPTDVTPRPAGPRILAIMGSGEVAPTMMRVHRELLRLLDPAATATIVDTTYGFQENADDLTARMIEAFGVSVGRRFTVASYRSRDVGPVAATTALARIQAADYVLAGPGSPSYALRTWAGGPIPAALADKLASGGILTMASAAALTLGVVTVPVYEIYKVGADPEWLTGLNLLEPATGLRAAVVPHYDNAEGGNHDTRFCYLGERRLQVLEASLPDGAFVLGVDGHTALLLDLARGTARVEGVGSVTVRARGRSVVFRGPGEIAISALAQAGADALAGRLVAVDGGMAAAARRPAIDGHGADGGVGGVAVGSRPQAMVNGSGGWPAGDLAAAGSAGGVAVADRSGPAGAAVEAEFATALSAGDVDRALAVVLDLDLELEARLRAGEDSPELDEARARYRALIVRLTEAGGSGSSDERADALGPVIDTILDLRSRARAAGDWPTADRIRDRLVDAGIEVRDGAAGSEWSLGEPARH